MNEKRLVQGRLYSDQLFFHFLILHILLLENRQEECSNMKKLKKSCFEPCFAVDCDDVLVSCNEYALQLLNEESSRQLDIAQINRWGVLGNELDDRLHLFEDPTFVQSQPLYPDAQDFIHELKQMGSVVLVTSVPPVCVPYRAAYIERFFPYTDYVITNNKSCVQADVILDDNPAHLKTAKSYHKILYKRPWNAKETQYVSVSSLDEFLSFVREVFA